MFSIIIMSCNYVIGVRIIAQVVHMWIFHWVVCAVGKLPIPEELRNNK